MILQRRWSWLFWGWMLMFVACGTPVTESPKSGALQIEMMMPEMPAKVGKNIIHIQVKDAQGKMVPGCVLKVMPNMAAHGHGSSQESVISEEGKGHYHAEVFFQMKGSWDVMIRAEQGTEFGEKVFPISVP